jgi:hypothetical protein
MLCLILNTVYSNAQDLIYYNDGKIVERKVTGFTDEDIKATLINNPEITYSTRRSGVLFVFNSFGNFLVMSKLDEISDKSQPLINHFLNGSIIPNTSDRILTLQNKIITCNYETEDASFLNYSVDGKQDKIALPEVALVIFKNGTHKLYTDINKANQVLSSLQEAYDEMTANAVKQEALNKDTVTTMNYGITHLQSSDTILISKAPSGINNDINKNEVPHTESLPATTEQKEAIPVKEEKQSLETGEVSLTEYSERALRKTENLSAYIKVICDKSSDIDDINKAMKGALELFVNEEVWVEISSKNNNLLRRLKIRDYLNHLKLLNYQKVEIDWMNIQYVSQLHKAPDNNYYGIITFEQEFRGLKNNDLVYKDLTRKNVEVMLKTLPVSADGKTISKFDVLLSNIGVVETK